jgi:hypothetical protein
MGSLVEERTRHFYAWERRGRGWRSYPYPVALEPPFAPFRFFVSTAPPKDDGRHHTLLSGLLARLLQSPQQPPSPETGIEAPEPEPLEEDEAPVELRVLLPEDLAVTPALCENWLRHLAVLRAPASFELIATGGRISVVLTARRGEAPLLTSPLRAFFPGVVLEEAPGLLMDIWESGEESIVSAVELGLKREFMVPLDRPKGFSPDPLTAIVGALAQAEARELAIVQVLFQGVQAPWAESVARSVVTRSGDPFFADAPEITALAREKTSAPLFAVALRVVARSSGEERLWTLLRGILGAISATSRAANELVPLGADDMGDVLSDVLLRTTHRSGMILSLPELLPLVHLPSASIEGILRETSRTKALPAEGQAGEIFLGHNVHSGVEREARLAADARMRHLHVVGASGTGKSTLLVSMILQDIKLGHGLGVIDPHGDLIDEVLGRMPENRADDVILFDPADPA